jgi:hypothetical protein
MNDSVSAETLTTALIQRGVLAPNTPPFIPQTTDRPWFVSTLLGVAGWFAGIFVLFFVGILFRPSEAGQFAVIAAVLVPAAFGLYAADRHNAFFDQLALALSIAGQVAATAAFAEATKSAALATAAVAVMQCVLLVIMPNALARSIAAFFACIAWALAIRFAWWDENWLYSRTSVALGPALIGWFVIWIPIGAIVTAVIASESRWMASKARNIGRPALGGMLLALTLGTFASVPLDAFAGMWNTDLHPKTNWLVLWPLLNVAAALLASFGAFRLRNTALMGVAVAVAMLHVMHFYYLLGTTLLLKSAIMLILGAALLGCGVILQRRRRDNAA